MARKVVVVIIDLEEDDLALRFERTKVVFFMWIVGMTEVVIDRDGLDNSVDGSRPQGGHTGCDDGKTSREFLPQLIIEGAYLLCLAKTLFNSVLLVGKEEGKGDARSGRGARRYQFKRSADFRRRMHQSEGRSRSHYGWQMRMIAPFQSEHVFLVELDGLCFPPLLHRPLFFREDDLVETDHRPMGWIDRGLGCRLIGIGFDRFFDLARTDQAEGRAMPLKRTASFFPWPAQLEQIAVDFNGHHLK